MKQIKFLVTVSVFFAAFSASAELKNWDAILAKATPQEKSDLGKILQQIRMVPAKDPLSGKQVYKVMAVEKGSVFDREGVQKGDLISAGSWATNGTTMNLNNTKKIETQAEKTSQ